MGKLSIWRVYECLQGMGFQMKDGADGVIAITVFALLVENWNKGRSPDVPEFLRLALWAAKMFPHYEPLYLMNLANQRVLQSCYRSWLGVYRYIGGILNGKG